MQPQSAHDRYAGNSALAHRAVKVEQHPIAEFQIFSANALDFRIVQLAGVRNRGAVVILHLDRAGITGVPAPWKSQLPGAAVRTKQGAECAKLKPAHVKLCCEFGSGNESADIRSPIRDSCQPRVDRDGNLGLQCLPC